MLKRKTPYLSLFLNRTVAKFTELTTYLQSHRTLKQKICYTLIYLTKPLEIKPALILELWYDTV